MAPAKVLAAGRRPGALARVVAPAAPLDGPIRPPAVPYPRRARERAVRAGVDASLLINGRETTDTDLRAGTLRLELLLDARGKLSCQLIDPPVPPVMDDDVLLSLDGVPVFGGILVDVALAVGEDWQTPIYTLTAADNTAIMDGLFINGISPAGTLKSVLEWMISVGLGGNGFTLHGSQATGILLPELAWPFQSYASAIQQLCVLTQWTSSVSPLRVLRLYPGGTVPAPWPIDETTDTIEALTTRRTRGNHATVVWVRYGNGAPSDVTWSTSADGVATAWQTDYTVSVAPNVVSVAGATQPLGAYPPAGGWAGWTFEVLPHGLGVLHSPAGAPAPAAGTALALTYTAAWPNVVNSVDYTIPLQVHVVVDYPDIFDADTAQALADGELARRQGYPQAFSLQTARVGLMPGQTVALDVPRLGLETAALVTGVRLAHVSTRGDGAPWWRYDVDMTEGNASRGNWLSFWDTKAAGKGGGGSGSGVTGTLPPATGGASAFAVWPLGGDHDTGYQTPAPAWQPIANAVLVTPPASFTGRVWTVYATVKRLLGAGTFRLALTNAAGVNVATSAVLSGDFVAVQFEAPVAPGDTYHLRGSTSDAGTLYGTTAYLEAVQL
jgi:hypothetical protein